MGWVTYVVSLAVWCGLYQFLSTRSVWRYLSAEWNCRMVTLVHATWATVSCFISAFICGPFPITQPGGDNNALEDFIMSSSLAYFTFDIIWCILHNTEGIVMLCHHAVSITGMLLSLLLGVSGTDVIGCIGGSEVTNPLLQLRWFLRHAEQHRVYPALYEAVELTFVALFGAVRCGVGTVFLIAHLRSPHPRLVFRVCGVLMYLVSWVFYGQILRYAWRKYRVAWLCTEPPRTRHRVWTTLVRIRREGEGGTAGARDHKPLVNGIPPTATLS